MFEGKQFNLGGLELCVLSSNLNGNKLTIYADIVVREEYNHTLEVEKLFNDISEMSDKMKISEYISEWYVNTKILLRQNVSIMVLMKKPILAGQLRKLFRAGESWHEVINVLSYSMFDCFWSGIVARNYKILAGSADKNKIPIYFQIKDQMIAKMNQEKEVIEDVIETGEIDL